MSPERFRDGVALIACVLTSVVCACGGGAGSRDGAMADDGTVPGVDVAAPVIPWRAVGVPPIVLVPCPTGWREVPGASAETSDTGQPATCEPYPAGGSLDCPVGEAHFPGEPGCVPVGAACPAGEFSDDLPTDRRVVHVRPGATGGDGTAARPYGNLTEFSVGGLPMGSVIALSAGSHEGPARLSRGLVLQGACARTTVLRTAASDVFEGVVTIRSSQGGVRDLTIADSPRFGVRLQGDGADGRLEGVIFDGVQTAAIAGTDLSNVSAVSVLIRDTVSGADGMAGRGSSFQTAATAELSRAVLVRNRDVGVFASDLGTTVTIHDVLIDETQSRTGDRTHGWAANAQMGAALTIRRAAFTRNREFGALASDPGSSLAASDVLIRDTDGEEAGGFRGRGLTVAFGAEAMVERVVVERSRDVGVLLATAAVQLSDVIVQDTAEQTSDGNFGRGLALQMGATVEASRLLVSRNLDLGAFVADEETTLSLVDGVIRDTGGRRSDGNGGRGLGVQDGATVDVTRALISSNHDLGVSVSDAGTSVRLADVVVTDTASRTCDLDYGRGSNVQRQAALEMSRAELLRNRDVTLSVHSGGTAVLEDIVIEGTLARGCFETTCTGAGAGHGVGAFGMGSAIRMTRFVVRGSALCGIQLAADASLDLEDGEVSVQPIGACVQVEGYDTTRLTTGVRYQDNDTNLQATSLPVPQTVEVTVPSAAP